MVGKGRKNFNKEGNHEKHETHEKRQDVERRASPCLHRYAKRCRRARAAGFNSPINEGEAFGLLKRSETKIHLQVGPVKMAAALELDMKNPLDGSPTESRKFLIGEKIFPIFHQQPDSKPVNIGHFHHGRVRAMRRG